MSGASQDFRLFQSGQNILHWYYLGNEDYNFCTLHEVEETFQNQMLHVYHSSNSFSKIKLEITYHERNAQSPYFYSHGYVRLWDIAFGNRIKDKSSLFTTWTCWYSALLQPITEHLSQIKSSFGFLTLTYCKYLHRNFNSYISSWNIIRSW